MEIIFILINTTITKSLETNIDKHQSVVIHNICNLFDNLFITYHFLRYYYFYCYYHFSLSTIDSYILLFIFHSLTWSIKLILIFFLYKLKKPQLQKSYYIFYPLIVISIFLFIFYFSLVLYFHYWFKMISKRFYTHIDCENDQFVFSIQTSKMWKIGIASTLNV